MLFLLLLFLQRTQTPPYQSYSLCHYQKLGISGGGSWCFQCPSWPFAFFLHDLTFLPLQLKCPSYQQGDPEQPILSNVSSWLPLSPVCSHYNSHTLYLFFWVELSVFPLFTSAHLSLFHHIPFSVLWGHPGFDTMDFLVRYSGSNSATSFVTLCSLLLGIYSLWASFCKIEILLLPLIVWILNEIIHENYFEICWSIICASGHVSYHCWHILNLSISVSPQLFLIALFHLLCSKWKWYKIDVLDQLCPTLCDPRTVAHQSPLSMGFSRWEYWNGLPFPPPGDLPDPGIEPMSPESPASPALADGFFTTVPLGKLMT